MAEKVLPVEIEQLLTYLSTTGTGETKLTAIRALALQCSSLDEFMQRLDSVAPAATVDKAKKYLEQLPAVKAAMKAPLKQEVTTTTKTEVTTETVTRPIKDPIKEVEGSKKAKEEATDEEPSEVADLNVTDAKEAITRMRSTDKLRHIAANDARISVQKAATDRLNEIEQPPTA